MKNFLALGIAVSMTLTGCSSMATSTQIQPGSPSVSSQSAAIKGRLVLPYGMQTTTRVSQGSFNLLNYVIGEAAHAQEAPADGAEPLTEAEAQNLTATVDGETVELDVTAVTSSGDETVIAYEIDAAPVGDGLEVVEITTTEGEPLGGVIVEAPAGTTTTTEITPETTAVLETAVEKKGAAKIADMTAAELSALKLDPAVLQKAAAIRSILKKDGTLKPHLARRFKEKGHAAATDGHAKAEAARAKAQAAKAQAEAAGTKPAEPKTRAQEAKAKAEVAKAAKAAAEAESTETESSDAE